MNRVLGGDDRDSLKKEVLRFDIAMDDTALFVEISDAVGNLEDDVSSEVLAKVSEFNDLVE